MKSKIIKALLSVCLVFIVYTNSFAQSAQEFLDPVREASVSTKNFSLAFMIKTTPPLVSVEEMSNLRPMLQTDYETFAYFKRLIWDRKNKLTYEYNLEVSPIEGSNQFRVRFIPGTFLAEWNRNLKNAKKDLEDWKAKNPSVDISRHIDGLKRWDSVFEGYTNNPIPKYPDELTVNDGDIIALDILKDPKTGMIIQDLIRVTKETKPEGYFWDVGEARSFSLNDVQFNFREYQIYANGILTNPPNPENPPKPDDGGVSYRGGWGEFSTPKGKYLLSPSPNEKYNLEKIGIIENDTLIINHLGDTFKIVSKVPILGKPGKWILWGKFKPRSNTGKPNNDPPRIFAGDYADRGWLK